jgi:hypothetical protein
VDDGAGADGKDDVDFVAFYRGIHAPQHVFVERLVKPDHAGPLQACLSCTGDTCGSRWRESGRARATGSRSGRASPGSTSTAAAAKAGQKGSYVTQLAVVLFLFTGVASTFVIRYRQDKCFLSRPYHGSPA